MTTTTTFDSTIIGKRARLRKCYDVYPVGVFSDGLTGTVRDLQPHEGERMLFLHLDRYVSDLDDWENTLQVQEGGGSTLEDMVEVLGSLDDILPADVARAARMDDLNAAALSLQRIAGITDGGIAGQCLDDDDWAEADETQRNAMLAHWLRVERMYAEDHEADDEELGVETIAPLSTREALEECKRLLLRAVDVSNQHRHRQALQTINAVLAQRGGKEAGWDHDTLPEYIDAIVFG